MYNQQDVDSLLAAPIGSLVSVRGSPSRVIGRYQDRYIYEGGEADAYILSLEGRREVGVEYRTHDRHFWTSRFVKRAPISSLGSITSRLRDIEWGYIVRNHSEGEVCDHLPRYAFGRTTAGTGVFLAFDETNVDIWFPETIKLEDVEVVVPTTA